MVPLQIIEQQEIGPLVWETLFCSPGVRYLMLSSRYASLGEQAESEEEEDDRKEGVVLFYLGGPERLAAGEEPLRIVLPFEICLNRANDLMRPLGFLSDHEAVLFRGYESLEEGSKLWLRVINLSPDPESDFSPTYHDIAIPFPPRDKSQPLGHHMFQVLPKRRWLLHGNGSVLRIIDLDHERIIHEHVVKTSHLGQPGEIRQLEVSADETRYVLQVRLVNPQLEGKPPSDVAERLPWLFLTTFSELHVSGDLDQGEFSTWPLREIGEGGEVRDLHLPGLVGIGGTGGRWIVKSSGGSVQMYEWDDLKRDYPSIWDKELHVVRATQVGFIGNIGFSAGEDVRIDSQVHDSGPDFCIFFDPHTGEEIGRLADYPDWYAEHGGDIRFPPLWVVAGSPDGRFAFVYHSKGIAIYDLYATLHSRE